MILLKNACLKCCLIKKKINPLPNNWGLAHKSVFLNVSSDFILFFYFDNQFVPPNDVPCIIFYFCFFKNKNVLEENPVKSIQFQFY